jgi:ankyrin repeat protein
MGICNSSNDEKRKSNPNHREANKNPRNTSKSRGLVKADLDDDSHQISENIDQRDAVLKRGQRKELQNMIENYNEEIDDYAFGQNKTLLLQACMICPNPDVVDMIMAKGADVDKEEYQTGNTALFLSAVDLKVDFVKKLLKYNPNLQHRNHAGQNIFDFLNFQLFEQRKKIGREMTEEERDKYQEIENMLNDYVGKE